MFLVQFSGGSMGIMLVYDITNEKSFENIVKWLRNIDEVSNYSVHGHSNSFSNANGIFFLVGNFSLPASTFFWGNFWKNKTMFSHLVPVV